MQKVNKKSNQMSSQIRLIGGNLRGRKIHFCDFSQEGLRPTPNRVRETLFNWLSTAIIEATCLDAFGGSGALSFEAISRGAKRVILLEKSPQILQAIKENAERFDLTSSELGSPLVFSCTDALTYLAKTSDTFDIIFLDPPFQQDLLYPGIQCIAERGLLRSGGYLYMESHEPISPENIPFSWKQIQAKKAGSVFFGLLHRP